MSPIFVTIGKSLSAGDDFEEMQKVVRMEENLETPEVECIIFYFQFNFKHFHTSTLQTNYLIHSALSVSVILSWIHMLLL